jgi:hypothetical protein
MFALSDFILYFNLFSRKYYKLCCIEHGKKKFLNNKNRVLLDFSNGKATHVEKIPPIPD